MSRRFPRKLRKMPQKCLSPRKCSPGKCEVRSSKEKCFCPVGYVAVKGACRKSKTCLKLSCEPGVCIVKDGEENCHCPSNYTVRDNKCIEIKVQYPGTVVTTLLLVIVAAASVVLTSLLAVIVCYVCVRRQGYQDV